MHLIPLKRKISRIEIDEKEMMKLLPKKIIKVLEVLAPTKNIIIKGGFAKAILGQILKNEKKIKKNRAIENAWEKPLDIDLILTFTGTKKKNLTLLNEKVIELKEKLKKTGFELSSRDIELIKGGLNNERTIRKILETREMTINEVILVPEEKQWFLYHTDKAHRDTINSVAMLTVNNPPTVRYDYGRLITSPYGTIRLIRFFIEEKVETIYLPRWWIERNNKEAEKASRPKLASYGLILVERYAEFPKLQTKLMKILNEFELTNANNFDEYKKEQEILFQKYSGKKFKLIKETSFEQLQRALSKKQEQQMSRRRERKELRTACSHFVESFICSHCDQACTIKYCVKCSKIEITPKKEKKPLHIYELFCNKRFITADPYWDKQGFFPEFPAKIKQEI